MRTRSQKKSDYHYLPDFLRELREAAELSQRDIAAKLDRPQSWVHRNEEGSRRVDLPEFIRWCQACNADPIEAVKRYMRSMGKE